jgi:hypothetical protein
MQGRLRIVDADHDGYPDILMTTRNYDGSTQTQFLSNHQGSSLKKSSHLSDVLAHAGSTADLVTFIDVDEDGRLDFLIQQKHAHTGKPYLQLIYNNQDTDTFFLKAYMLNSKQTKAQNFYGDSTSGANFRFIVTDLDDQKYVAAAHQQPQHGY